MNGDSVPPDTTDETDGATARAPRDSGRFFNDVASMFDRLGQCLDAPALPVNRWLEAHIGSGRRALDVGCGTGRNTVKLADCYDDVVGVDVAPAMIEIAERDRLRPNIRYQTRDVLSLTPEHDGRFDLVFGFGCVVHVGPPELVLGHLRRLVAKGGTLLFVEAMWEPEWGSRDWQVDRAFRIARDVWKATGDLDDVAAVLPLALNPMFLELTEKISIPPNRDDFLRDYSAALPGVTIEEKDVLGYRTAMVSWHAKDEH